MISKYLFVFFLISGIASAQNYDTIDAKVATYPKSFTTIQLLGDRIAKDFKSNEDRSRAIFTWLATHITYDLNEYKHINFSGTISYDSEEELQQKLRAIDLKIINRAWKYKRSVCEGYSLLFKELCDQLNIPCKRIRGYTKTQPQEIGRVRNTVDHIWNAIKINGQWQLVDSTWAAGYILPNGWNRHFNGDYFLIKPERLILTHFPEESSWQMLKNTISKKAFFNFPIYYSHGFFYTIQLAKPHQGALQKNTENGIKIAFKEIPKEKMFYAYETDEYSEVASFELVNNEYITTIPKKRGKYLTFYIDGVSVLDFKVIR